MSWRITGTEQLDVTEAAARAPRQVDAQWDDSYGHLVLEPGSEWIVSKLRIIDGEDVRLYPAGDAPVFHVDLGDRASTYWAVHSLLVGPSIEATNPPDKTWVEPPLEEGAVN